MRLLPKILIQKFRQVFYLPLTTNFAEIHNRPVLALCSIELANMRDFGAKSIRFFTGGRSFDFFDLRTRGGFEVKVPNLSASVLWGI